MEEKVDLNKLDEFSLDLRISLLHCCFKQANYSRIIKEIPSKFCHNGSLTNPNFNKLKQTIKKFPIIKNIKQEWNELNEEIKCLIEWFIKSTPMKLCRNKEGLSFLPKPDLNEILNCKYQFIINRDDKFKFNDFIKCKKEYGSIIAYHGSPSYNWHSIIQNNLQNYSNTKQMTSGALFGDGIYLTTSISLSRSFSKMNKAWNKSKIGTHLSVVGVFEIALHPKFVKCDKVKDKKMKAPKHYYIVKDNRYIKIKGLLVWKQTKKEKDKKNKLSAFMILFYVVLIICVIIAQVKWDKVIKRTTRYIDNFMRMR